MLIEIKKVLKKGIGILLVIILVGVGVTKFKDNKKKKDFLYHDHDSIVAKYGKEGELSKKNLIQIKRLFGNNIEKFELGNYTAREAKMAGFSDEEIFNTYNRDEIIMSYEGLNEEALEQIKYSLYDNIFTFMSLNYTAREAKMAGFSNEEIFRAYSRDAIVEVYGDYLGKLGCATLYKIKTALRNNILYFAGKGYTVKEAKMAGFDNEEIFGAYYRNAILEEYGDINKELNREILYKIGRACFFNIYAFEEKGYTAREAKMAGFSNEEIFRAYSRDAIVEAYGYTNKELDYEILVSIRQALGYNLCDFEEKGYTAKEARLAGFSAEEISRIYG